MVNIAVDYGKCQNAYTCKKCVSICPLAVLALVPLENRLKMEKPREPEKWKIVPELCNQCSKCVDICPQNAITL